MVGLGGSGWFGLDLVVVLDLPGNDDRESPLMPCSMLIRTCYHGTTA